ncbi:MAG: phage major capsid protein [Pseudomonadota bacterium]
MLNLGDHLEDVEYTLETKRRERDALVQRSTEGERSFNSDEIVEFDTLTDEIENLEATHARLKGLENEEMRTATAPSVIKNRTRGEHFAGQSFTRAVIARAAAQLDNVSPIGIAKSRWGRSDPQIVEYVKAAVEGGGSGTGEWGSELVTANNRFTGDFIEYLNSVTVFNQLPLREVPANVTIKGQDGAGTGYWVGESKAIPVTAMDFDDVTLKPLKAAALAVVSNELLRDSSPAAEALVRDALVEAASQRIDNTFLSDVAEVTDVSPAGLLNGLTAITSSGTDGDALRNDIKALYAPFITAKNASGLVLVMPPVLAKAISLMTNDLNQFEFAELNTDGGMLLGDRVVTGDNVATDRMILLKPSDIYKIGDGGIQVSMSRDAMIEMDTAPTGDTQAPTAASANMVSMFQSESTAIKVVRSLNFAKRRASAVAYLTGANYGAAA